MKFTKSILAATLAAALALTVPVFGSGLGMSEYVVKITSISEGAVYDRELEEGYDTETAGQYTATVTYDDNKSVSGASVKYGDDTVYDAGASYVGMFPQSLYLYDRGILKLFRDGETKDVLKVQEDLLCVNVSDSGGMVYAYFLDTSSRDFYAYNLTEGSSAKGNVGKNPVLVGGLISYGSSAASLQRTGEYISVQRYDLETGEALYTVLKQDGNILTVFEPDFSSISSSNPKGGELMLLEYDGRYGYLDDTGKPVGLYDDASAFFYNEKGQGVAFVTDNNVGYFVDSYLNKISEAFVSYGAYCSKEGVFVIHSDENWEKPKTYTVELVDSKTGGVRLYGLIAAAVAVAVAGVIIYLVIRKRHS